MRTAVKAITSFIGLLAAIGAQAQIRVERDWNHPSIVIQSIMNGQWGMDSTQAFADELGKLQQNDLVMAGFTAHNFTSGASAAEFLRLQLVGASGAILAQNHYRFAVYPKTFRFRR
jgi:hypothetical protein